MRDRTMKYVKVSYTIHHMFFYEIPSRLSVRSVLVTCLQLVHRTACQARLNLNHTAVPGGPARQKYLTWDTDLPTKPSCTRRDASCRKEKSALQSIDTQSLPSPSRSLIWSVVGRRPPTPCYTGSAKGCNQSMNALTTGTWRRRGRTSARGRGRRYNGVSEHLHQVVGAENRACVAQPVS